MSKFIIRGIEASDHAFIFESWKNNLQNANKWYQEIPEEAFRERFNQYYQKIVNKPKIDIKIACLTDAPEVIIGYSIIEQEKIYWIYVKHSWRLMGVGSSLFPKEVNQCGRFLTMAGKVLSQKYKVNFNPFMEE